MKKTVSMYQILLLLFLSSQVLLVGQGEADVRLVPSVSEGENQCFDLQLLYSGKEVTLGSQNYRLFYNSESMRLIEEKSLMHLRSDHYAFKVVQHNAGIDASGVGDIAFEKNLGFINATIILNDPRMTGERLGKVSGWTPVIQFCFEQLKTPNKGDIILARKQLTSDYGRAFIELSYIDDTGAISSLPIKNYLDLDR